VTAPHERQAPQRSARRDFLKSAGLITVGAATLGPVACDAPDAAPGAATTDRPLGFDRPLLDALAVAVLPESLGAAGITRATEAFVQWVDGYEPVAEEMHGYGYSDIRYLPADPAPAWRAQLQGLDLLARKSGQKGFAELTTAQRRDVLTAVLRGVRGDRLPSPLAAQHIALALLAHWSSRPDAWNLALGVQVSPATCRVLADAPRKPLPIAGGPTS
jgi:hypothetical protein